jgi:ABC-type transport system substrate-binding protein
MRKKTTILFLSLLVAGMTFTALPTLSLFDRVTPFVYGVGSNPSSFDPCNAYDTTSGDIIVNVYEGLYGIDYAADKVIPKLAKDFGAWTANDTVCTIDLRQDVTWQDGSAFTADDVVWNFERLAELSESDQCKHASLWFNDDGALMWNKIEKTGDYQVKFTLNKTWFDFEKLLPFWGSYLIKPIDGYKNATLGLTDIKQMIGTGPFKLDSFTPDEKTVLTRYDDYYGGAADIEKLIFQQFGGQDAMDQAFLKGEIAMARSLSDDAIATAASDPDLQYKKIKGSCCYFYHLNVNNIPLAARRAMAFAFNYSYFINVVRNGREFETHTPIPEGMEGWNPNVPGLPLYNLTYARQVLLNDIGTKSDYGTKLANAGITSASNTSAWRTLAEGKTPLAQFNFTDYGLDTWYTQLRDNFADIGFNIIHDTVGDWSTFLDYTDNNIDKLEITMGGWCPDYFDPVNMIEPLFATNASSNWNGLANTTINANLAKMHTTTGAEKQTVTDLVVHQIFVEQVAGMYIMQNAAEVFWNSKYITAGIEDQFSARGDRYFYNIVFDEDAVPQGVPGYTLGIFALAALGATVALIVKKRS